MPILVPGSTFLERLMVRRNAVDLYPWVELMKGGTTAVAAPAGTSVPLSIKVPYALDLGEFTYYGLNQPSGGNFITGQVTRTVGALGSDQASRAFSQEVLYGNPGLGWWGNGIGAFYAPNEIIRHNFQIDDAIAAVNTGLLHVAGRGYREYAKGSINPPQLTKAEYVSRGFALEPYDYGGRVTIPNAAAAGTPFQFPLTLDRDFLADDLTINVYLDGDDFNTWPPAGDPTFLLECQIASDRVMMSEPVLRFGLVGEPNRFTAWRWPIPVSMNKGLTLYFTGQIPAVSPGVVDVDFILHGHLLHAP